MWDWISKAKELKDAHRVFAIVTITQKKGSAPRDAGTKMIVCADGSFFGTVGGGNLEDIIISDAQKLLVEANDGSNKYPLCFRTGQCCGGAVETYTEIFGLEPRVSVFGMGHVGQALIDKLNGTPFRIIGIDSRESWREMPNQNSNPIARRADWVEFVQSHDWNKNIDYALVMTHDHALDLKILSEIAAKPAKFIGLIGSETKWQRFQMRLKNLGVDEDLIQRIQCPIGDNNGGYAPSEIAISISQYLLKKHYESH